MTLFKTVSRSDWRTPLILMALATVLATTGLWYYDGAWDNGWVPDRAVIRVAALAAAGILLLIAGRSFAGRP